MMDQFELVKSIMQANRDALNMLGIGCELTFDKGTFSLSVPLDMVEYEKDDEDIAFDTDFDRQLDEYEHQVEQARKAYEEVVDQAERKLGRLIDIHEAKVEGFMNEHVRQRKEEQRKLKEKLELENRHKKAYDEALDDFDAFVRAFSDGTLDKFAEEQEARERERELERQREADKRALLDEADKASNPDRNFPHVFLGKRFNLPD